MQAGRMRERITIQANTPSQDTYGEAIASWSTDDTVWASVLPVSGGERLVVGADQVQATLTHRVSLRYRSTLTPRHRLVWETRVLDIERIENPDGKKHEMVLLCREVMEETATVTVDLEVGNPMGLLLAITYASV